MEGIVLLVVIWLLGWVLGLAGFFQARKARREVQELRQALAAAQFAIPPLADQPIPGQPMPSPWQATPPPPAEEPAAAPAAEAAPEPAFAAVPPAEELAPARRRPGLEEALTMRWGVWLGAAALLLAGVFLVRYAVEEGLLGPAARCIAAALLGLALIIAAEVLRRRAPPPPAAPEAVAEEEGEAAAPPPAHAWPDYTPSALAAGGVAVLFGAAYGAAVLYALVPPLLGFALLAAAALAGMALALLQGPLVAAVGIIGAFTTPGLVESQNPSIPGLFAYLFCVTVAALAVLRQVAATWLGWLALIGCALWVLGAGPLIDNPGDLWAPALFIPAVTLAHLLLLPAAALDQEQGRHLAWLPLAILAAALLSLVPSSAGIAPAVGVLLLSPILLGKAMREPRLDLLPWLGVVAGLALLLLWPIGLWQPGVEKIVVGDVVQAIIPAQDWAPQALQPFLVAAALLALLHGAAGWWQETRAPHALRWSSLLAVVPLLALALTYLRVRRLETDVTWALAALALAALLIFACRRAMAAVPDPDLVPDLEPEEDAAATPPAPLLSAGAHAAGAVAALSLGLAMLLREQWLTLAIAFTLPPLAVIAARTGLLALRRVATAVALLVMVRMVLNPWVLDYGLGSTPVLNNLLLVYGVPAACFAAAAVLFYRQVDDRTVRVLEAGAILLGTLLVVLQVHHFTHGGTIRADYEGADDFLETGLLATLLALLSLGLLLLNRRMGGRRVSFLGWRVQLLASAALGLLALLDNPAWASHAIGAMPVLNELLLAYALPALLVGMIAWQRENDSAPRLRKLLALYALTAAFGWISLEVRHAFHPDRMPLWRAAAGEAELYAYSGAWLGFGAALLVAGIRLRQAPLRLAALAVLGITILKVFLVDMSELVGLWRVASFLGLGLALIALGAVYRRFVVNPSPSGPPPPDPAAAA